MRKEAIIIGYSGHAFVVLDVLLANKYKVSGYCEQELKLKNPYELSYLGSEGDEKVIEQIKDLHAFIAIGDNYIRAKIFERLMAMNVSCPILVHPHACLSSKAKLGLGTVVMPGVVVNSCTEIGNAVICNSSAVIEHECLIGDYSHIAPGAVLAGNVIVGRNTFVGANAVIRQGVKIGSEVIIGAGSVVIRDVPDGSTVYGNPSKKR
ncbi:acetyltransferase EpsM [Pedobacter steynii]|uniref:Acetyltransferase EpsM n=1 Tax=Pedobacter steynii TaxID=430522 RepID=A0A1G9WF20_9SPHI|nr:acetyltransferase [Pedobacter steynii]NQX40280.1 acetyltransferase [Pedobacter steynii]SDM83164.1 acetyltransferase EpsM [Pedobacter steynii]